MNIPVAPNCDSPGQDLLSVDEARQRIMDLVTPLTTIQRVALRDALDRVLARAVVSTIDVPPCDNSAMDGYAVRAADLANGHALTVIGESFAGHPFDGEMQGGQAIRIMTGAMMPAGADTVIMQEQVTRDGDNITIAGEHREGENVRRAGEDMRRGETVLEPGHRITAADLGLIASLGLAEVDVFRRPRVAFFSTGDELKGVGEPLGDGDIYDSNRYTLYGMLQRLNVDLLDMGVIPDDRKAIERAFAEAAKVADAVITSGGVSVGEADFVKLTLDKLGQVDFWRIRMKPGKPLAVGKIGDAFFFGLPGNPVSAMATFYQFAQPALKKLAGDQRPQQDLILRLPCATKLKKAPGRLEFQRGVMRRNDAGELVVDTTGVQGSHILTSMSRANCFIILPADSSGAEPGELVDVQPFAGII